MEDDRQIIITISRQLGSAGEYIGQQIAEKLQILYLDREIIEQAAKQFTPANLDLEARDEKVPSFWKSLFQSSGYISQDGYITPQIFPQTDRDLYNVETDIIERVAKDQSAVIIGRCGWHILREHPNHISIFFHADPAFRKSYLQKLYHITEDAAEQMMNQSDKDRSRYVRTFTDNEMHDARQYDLSINTGRTSLDDSVKIILDYIESRQIRK